MDKRVFAYCLAGALGLGGFASGQTFQRQAYLTGGGGPDRGKCTIEVVVDGAAEIEIRGQNGTLRNLSGQPPEWRRFECTERMPANPDRFRFIGVDGRGSQELVRSPQGGGVAVVRIQDRDGGAEGYTFDLVWGTDYDWGGPVRRPGEGPGPGPGPRPGGRISTQEAIRICQNEVRRQAFERYQARDISFRTTTLDDNPGRRDWLTGLFDIRRGFGPDETFRFSCSTNFDTGQVRSVQIDPMDRGRGWGWGREGSNRAALEGCQQEVEERIRRDGYQHVDFLSVEMDNRPGRNDWVVGRVRADFRLRSQTFDFSCSVNLQNGNVRSVNVNRRR